MLHKKMFSYIQSFISFSRLGGYSSRVVCSVKEHCGLKLTSVPIEPRKAVASSYHVVANPASTTFSTRLIAKALHWVRSGRALNHRAGHTSVSCITYATYLFICIPGSFVNGINFIGQLSLRVTLTSATTVVWTNGTFTC